MSLYHVGKCFRRCLLFDQHFSSHSSSSSPYDNHFCFPLSRSTSPTPGQHSNTHNHHHISMDVHEIKDHYNAMLRTELDSSKKSKHRSSLIESLKHKSTTATLFSPRPLSLDTTNVAAASSLSLASTLSSSSLPRSLLSPFSPSLLHCKHPVPYFVSCFSPLDLPSEIFVYFLQFLSPADLWRLCQVSHGMQAAIARYMSKIQRFKFGAVRILHQENLRPDSDPMSPGRGRTLYEHTAHAASSSSLSSQVRSQSPMSRSKYWMSQARYLVATINEGSKGACAKIGREPSVRRMEALTPSSSAASSSVDLLHDQTEALLPSLSSVSTPSSQPPAAWSTDTLVASSAHSSTWSLAPSNASQVSLVSTQKQATDLPLERFGAVVDLIFDPNIVPLNHRRAIINCARYVSASIDESYTKTANTQDPSNSTFHAQFLAKHSVSTGPYLTVFSPIPGEAESLELSPRERTPAESIRSTIITPPRRLHNYFQVMLWQRCLSDLITLYNRVQSRHVDGPSNKTPYRRITYCQELNFAGSSASISADMSPFCCKAHSLVFTTQYPFSFVPYSFRVHFRRMARKVQSVSNKSVWSNAFGEHRERGVSPRRRIQYTGPVGKLRFCDGATSYQTQNSAPTSPSSPKQHAADDDDEFLIQRRFRVDERTRQDNLIKQELLALCHMACGLFLADDRSTNPPPTLMSLLRQGSPWHKGVWREGEWQHSPIEVVRQRPHSRSHSSSQEIHWAAAMNTGDHGSKSDSKDMGRWQKLCIATIQFLAHEDLAWGGNRTNKELSDLRATSNATSWSYYHD
ncbi:hypothetical protein B0O80DRAFT_448349 [Mortierella sp. GBAus27b]|nr:hypothetical protein B0O80DRAFT_448349 [Mortierella sp. GBAus27b]